MLARLSDFPQKLFHLKGRQLETVKRINRVEINRDRNDLSVNARAHAVLIRAPFGETRKIFKHVARIRVKDMWTVFMNKHTMLVVMIVGVAANVRTLVAQQHLLVRTAGEALREHTARESRSNNQ